MKKIGKIVLGGIQNKIFNLVIIVMILMVAAFVAVIIYQSGSLTRLINETNDRQKESISQIAGETMHSVISQSLVRTTQLEAYAVDKLFQDLQGDVGMVADYAAQILQNPDAYEEHEIAGPDASLDGEVTMQLLSAEDADLDDPEVQHQLAILGNMEEMMAGLFRSSQINSCYIAIPEGAMLLTDNEPSSKFDDNGDIIPIPIQERAWYQGATETGDVFFTEVERDVFTGKIGIMCAIPVYVDGELAAVAGADLFLDAMEASINSAGDEASFVCIINDQGHVLFSPKEEGAFQVEVSSEAKDLRTLGNEELSSFLTEATQGITDTRLVSIDGKDYYMIGAPAPTIRWSVVNVVDKAAADQPAAMMEQAYNTIMEDAQTVYQKELGSSKWTIIVLLLIILLLAMLGTYALSRRIVKPLEAMTKRVGTLGGDQLQFKMEKAYKTGDEIEVLAESFASLSAKTVKYIDQVKTVTAEKERIGAELNMAEQIQASQLPRLFPAFPNRPEFDVFASMTPAREVGGDFYDFFLVDDNHIALVMADVSGKGVPAALFMMVSRVLIKTSVQNGYSPSEALSRVNDQLCESNEAELFVTVWLAVIDVSTGKGVAANAGHEHPVLRRAGGEYELVVYRHSPAVATMEGMPFKQHEFQLNAGDSLFVYTDGVAEATNASQEMYGTDRLLTALNQDPDAAPEQILEHVRDSIQKFVADAEQFDDITMLCLKYNGPHD